MIIEYNIPFSKYRKLAKYYCKAVQYLNKPFLKRKFLRHLNSKSIDYREIPVIINNYNRLDYLEPLIDWLEKAEMKNIFIIDNNSIYPKLLEYYEKTNHTVIKLNANIGYKALWHTSIHLWFKGLPYVYTDPDILPVDECPLDAVKYFQETLGKHTEINKVGFGLRIDNIPDYYPNKQAVLKWESQFWKDAIDNELFKADIDTTFALYRENSVNQQWGKSLRTGGNYVATHQPWYENPENPTENELFYRKLAKGSIWYAADIRYSK
jgi:hypothetical protein